MICEIRRCQGKQQFGARDDPCIKSWFGKRTTVKVRVFHRKKQWVNYGAKRRARGTVAHVRRVCRYHDLLRQIKEIFQGRRVQKIGGRVEREKRKGKADGRDHDTAQQDHRTLVPRKYKGVDTDTGAQAMVFAKQILALIELQNLHDMAVPEEDDPRVGGLWRNAPR
jgi:hypothetical protein